MFDAVVENLIDLNQLAILGKICLSMLLGAVLGLERELAEKPAGLRTHMLVAAAATLLVSLGGIVVEGVGSEIHTAMIRSDPIRIMDAVITGISFLGAGSIIRGSSPKEIGGLTTAASLLVAGGLGMCIALSQYLLAVGLTVIVVFTLKVLVLVDWMRPQPTKQGRKDT